VPLPLASLLRDRFLTLMAREGDELDWSAIGGLAAKDAGEEGWRSQTDKSDNGAAIND
jgi:hypothetical protein